MGSCCSRPVVTPSTPNNNNNNTIGTSGNASPIPIGRSKPFTRRLKSTYKTPDPWTKQELKLKREQFWDTAPKYDGRPEIWQALKVACESDDFMAQAILDSAAIILPTGLLSDGAFDELGNRYVIPEYCFIEPQNIKPDSANSSSTKRKQGSKESIANAEKSINLLLRLSTMKDITLTIQWGSSVEQVQQMLLQQEPNLKNNRLRFILMGRPVTMSESLLDLFKSSDNCILQVMISGESR